MGQDATAFLAYGFIIPQPEVLEILQKLKNSTKKVKTFDYDEADHLQELLFEHLEITQDDFEMRVLTAREDDFSNPLQRNR